MWFIGVEVEEETSAPPPKKILDPPLPNHTNPASTLRFGTVLDISQFGVSKEAFWGSKLP